ncbi:MAG TPA: serine protease [Planctomycetaceae bacterium]|nr:serine protease [Planctomycetaceae bacterium]
MRITRLRRRFAYLALALATSSQGIKSEAQIVLRPTDNSSGYSAPESSRQRHVSRDVSQPLIGPDSFQAPAAAPSANRDSEYQEILAEANALQRQFNLIRRVVKFVSPSIVHIEATKTTDPGKGFASSRVEEAGAGVIISIDGAPYVLTNRHVIHSAELDAIRLELNDGRQLRATNVWTDPSTDVAVIRLAQRSLTAARLGNSDAMQVGDFVLAVGSPFGLSHSVTYGILSAKGRRNLELGSRDIQIQNFFQTDAAINPGNSGGPLLNLRGEIVGINTAIASNSGGNEGIGFTIPINMAIQVAEQLVSQGQLSKAQLGVLLDNNFTYEKAQQLGMRSAVGALVKTVIKGSAAEQAGFQVGDVIVQFGDTNIKDDSHLVTTVGLTEVGRQVRVVVIRDRRMRELVARIRRAPS